MNTKLLNQVANAILDEPTKFRMDDWTTSAEDAPCGTAACIAGHVAISQLGFKNPKALSKALGETDIYPEQLARDVLELDTEQGERLFYLPRHWSTAWPFDFAEAYAYAATPEERADIAFWRIQHFIATEGRE